MRVIGERPSESAEVSLVVCALFCIKAIEGEILLIFLVW